MINPELVIRPAEVSDVAAIAEMEKICFATPWSEDAIMHELAENPLAHYIVAEIAADTDIVTNTVYFPIEATEVFDAVCIHALILIDTGHTERLCAIGNADGSGCDFFQNRICFRRIRSHSQTRFQGMMQIRTAECRRDFRMTHQRIL